MKTTIPLIRNIRRLTSTPDGHVLQVISIDLGRPPPAERGLRRSREDYPTVGYSRTFSKLPPAMGSSKALHARRYRAFLERLRRARAEAGLTQVQVAVKLGRPQTWVSKCELGERRMDFVALEDFANACGKSLEFFRTRPHG